MTNGHNANSDDAFSLWTPPESPWSAWTKPVLFAHLHLVPSLAPRSHPSSIDVSWVPTPDQQTAIVLELPGATAIRLALHLISRGYRPVLLINAIASPQGLPATNDLRLHLQELFSASEALRSVDLPLTAPPAFILDADRHTGERPPAPGIPAPGIFDNRSVSLPTDFPSAAFLLSHGIKNALLIQSGNAHPRPPANDLVHTLLQWQASGLHLATLALNAATLNPSAQSTPLHIPRPSFLRWAWQRFTLTLTSNQRRNPLGGFGRQLPFPGHTS